MIKTMKSSKIRIWSDNYINGARYEKDENMLVIQAEPVSAQSNYIVEVISQGDYDKELSAGKETEIVHCKDCNAYTETGPGTGVCPALGGVAEYDGCTMGDRRLSAVMHADVDGRIVVLGQYPAQNRREAAEYLSDWLTEAEVEDASAGFFAIDSGTADVLRGVISALNNGISPDKEK